MESRNVLLLLMVFSIPIVAVSANQIDSLLNSNGLFDNLNINIFGNDPLISLATALSNPLTLSQAHNSFRKQFNKSSSSSSPLDTNVFKTNLLKIASHNTDARNGVFSFEMGVNKFSDMSLEQVISSHTGYRQSSNSSNLVTGINRVTRRGTPPQAVDWRNHNIVSSVKDQGGCGSCVLFSVAGCIESYWSIKNGRKEIDLSEQELLDCAQGQNYPGNGGCGGNTFVPTFNYVKNIGLTTEGEYRYTGKQGNCQSGGKSHPGRISNWWSVKSGDEGALKDAVGLRGPISVAICVNDAFTRYNSGVYDAPCNCGINHAVLAVGYGSEGGKDYWIVKNSWGPGWGDKGYIKMRRNYNNLCSIASDAVSCNPDTELDTGGDPGRRFVNVATSRCLDSNGNGDVYTLPCNGGAYQQWRWNSNGNIVNVQTGRCLDSYDGRVFTLGCNGHPNQKWGATNNLGVRHGPTKQLLDSNGNGNVYPLGENGGDYQKWWA